jgi:predicted transcriptional regulator of viral defense system
MHDKPAPDVRGLETLAFSQGGWFTAADARRNGVSSQLLHHHVRAGRFVRARRGLYRVHGFPSGPNEELRGRWLSVGGGRAIVCNESALQLLGISDVIPSKSHLLVSRRDRGIRRPEGVAIHTHSGGRPVSTVWRDGMPVTAPARTLVDVASTIQPDQLEAAVAAAIDRGLTTRSEIEREAQGRAHGRAVIKLLGKRGEA